MKKYLLDKKVNETLPTLDSWLKGAWLFPVKPGETADIRLFMDFDIARASHKDLIISFRDGAPDYIPAGNGLPARIEFGYDDMAFAHALIAETIRNSSGPALGEPASATLMNYAARVAASNAAILIQGETGTGKEGMARFVHKQSPRADMPFIAVNCAALPESMVEAILFGHKKGAFTGASNESQGLFRAADGGTLFLDEVTELPLSLQAKLLRALQENEILPVGETMPIKLDVRIVAAANRNFTKALEDGEFREDLYWRLNVMPIEIVPLRERHQDIRAITAAMLLGMQEASSEFAWPDTEALDTLKSHGWPGNARELCNILQRALIMREGERITANDLGLIPVRKKIGPRPDPLPEKASPKLKAKDLHSLARMAEYDAIESVLEETGGNRKQAAKKLGISERTLRYRLADMRELSDAA